MIRPPIGALWGWAQVALARDATPTLVRGTALILAPHPDDESIGCGLLLAQLARGGHAAAVALATDGGAGWYSTLARPDASEIVEIRKAEWHRALDALDVPPERRFAFGLPDGTLSAHEDEVTDRIGGLLRTLSPTHVFVTKPFDHHPDHQALSRATRRAVVDVYGPGSGPHGQRQADPGDHRQPPAVYAYRVYPGEGLWPGGRPDRARPHRTLLQLARSIVGLVRRRPLLLRAAGSKSEKAAAIGAYESQRKLLNGELRYVWRSGVELYWEMSALGEEGALPQ